MRTFTATILAAAAAICSLAAADSAGIAAGLRLAGGTPVALRLTTGLSSSEARVNDRVEFRVAREVRVGNTVVIARDSAAWGTVTEASPKGRMARAGKLTVHIESACLADGRPAPLRALERVDGQTQRAKTESGLGDTLLAFPAWPVMMFLYGKDRTIAAGSEVTAYIDREVTVDPLLIESNRTPGSCSGAPAPATPVTDACLTNVRSDPDGAEIYVDGKFVGNAPSRLRLAPGDREVTVAAPGRRTWRRTVAATAGGEINIAARLETETAGSASRVDPAAALSSSRD